MMTVLLSGASLACSVVALDLQTDVTGLGWDILRLIHCPITSNNSRRDAACLDELTGSICVYMCSCPEAGRLPVGAGALDRINVTSRRSCREKMKHLCHV